MYTMCLQPAEYSIQNWTKSDSIITINWRAPQSQHAPALPLHWGLPHSEQDADSALPLADWALNHSEQEADGREMGKNAHSSGHSILILAETNDDIRDEIDVRTEAQCQSHPDQWDSCKVFRYKNTFWTSG